MTPRYDIQANPRAILVSHMLGMQDRLNAVVNPQWARAGYNWTRAILVEGVELLEHYNRWKWWKKSTKPDIAQCQLELVDIFHFGLSHWMVRFGITDNTDWVLVEAVMRRIEAGRAFAAKNRKNRREALLNQGLSEEELETRRRAADDEAFNNACDRLVGSAAGGIFQTDAFFELCDLVGLDFQSMYRMYVGKNVLNTFRQRYGYKTGRYLKNWGVREDNDVLADLLDRNAGLTGQDYERAVLEGLDVAYAQACTDGAWHVIDLPGEAPYLAQVSEGAVLSDKGVLSHAGGDSAAQLLAHARPLPVREA